MKPIAILGAGIAGLTAAAALNRRGLPVIVFEAGKAVGGLASSFKDADGFAYDFGAHFVSNRLADALGSGGICRTVKRYGEAVHVRGKSYSYPFGLLASPRFAVSAARERLHERPVESAADWFRLKYGEIFAREVAIPLAEAWSGTDAQDLSPSLGRKFGPRILKALYLSAAAKVTGRAVCNGYSHEMPESKDVYHVYPEGGMARLLEPLVREIGHLIRLQSPVEAITVNEGRVRAVRAHGEEVAVSAAVSTAPVHVLPKLVQGTDALAPLASFRYRPMIFVNLHFNGRGLLPDTMLWVPDRTQPFFRLTETPISMPWLAPEGKTMITFDIGCEVGDEYWAMPDDRLAAICLDGFARIFPRARPHFLKAGGILKTPIAYPIYHKSYEAARSAFAASTGVDGLYSIGRNGEFAHILMEDVYWRTLKRCAEVDAYVRGRPLESISSVELAPSRLDAVPTSQPHGEGLSAA
jgi:protoporphyrinogen oxidase